MIDQSGIDLLYLIGADTQLKKAASTNGGEYEGPCPFCGGEDRFRVWPRRNDKARWWCRQCRRSGDAIGYVMERDNIEFLEACAVLGLPLDGSQHNVKRGLDRVPALVTPFTGTRRPNSTIKNYPAINNLQWQQAAEDFAGECFGRLHSAEGQRAREYLRSRGIGEEVMLAYKVGLNLEWLEMDWGGVLVKIGKGIIIPWHGDQAYLGLRVRPPGGGYYWAKGSAAKSLYGYQTISRNSIAVLVEAELDALTIHSQDKALREQGVHIVAVATGGSSNGRGLRWVARLNRAQRVLVAFDNDQAGDVGAAWWLEGLNHAERLAMPAKDPGEMYAIGLSILDWLLGALHIGSVNVHNPTLFGQPARLG